MRFSREFGGDGHSQGGARAKDGEKEIGRFDKIRKKVESMHATNKDKNEANLDGDDEVHHRNEIVFSGKNQSKGGYSQGGEQAKDEKKNKSDALIR